MLRYTFLFLFCLVHNVIAMDILPKKMSSNSLIRRNCPKNKVPLLQVLTAEQLYESFQMSKAPKIIQITDVSFRSDAYGKRLRDRYKNR